MNHPRPESRHPLKPNQLAQPELHPLQASFGDISRRKLLASIGIAGAAWVASRGAAQALSPLHTVSSVTYDTYGVPPATAILIGTLQQLEDAIATGVRTDVVIVQEIQIASDLVIPDTLTLIFQHEGALNIAAGAIVTIRGSVHAAARHIFKGAGQVDGLRFVKVDWFCEDGDSVADQADGIERAFFSKPLQLAFSKREYRYAREITVNGFDQMHVHGNGAKLVDTGKLLPARSGTLVRDTKNFCGFLFEQFQQLWIDQLTLSSTDEYWGAGLGGGQLLDATEQRPHLSIDGRLNQSDEAERRGKVRLSRIRISGKGGSYSSMLAQSTLKAALSPSFIRVTHCEQVELSHIELEGSSGGAEMICVGECSYLHLHDFTYVRSSDVFPVSLGKFIRCDRQLLERLYIDCPDHTPDCFDLSGKDEIVIRDSYVNWTGGDRFELTSEWKSYNIDIGHVYISNVAGICKDFMTVQTSAVGYENTIESITVRDMAVEAKFISSGLYAKRTLFENCTIQLLPGASGVYAYNNTEFSHCVFYPAPDMSTRIWPRAAGTRLKLNNCTLHQMQLWTGTSNVSSDIDIEFNHCDIVYEDYVGNPFTSAVYYGVNLGKAVNRLAFHDCAIKGPMRSRAFFIQNRSGEPDVIRELIFKNCSIDLTNSSLVDDQFMYGDVSLYTFDNNMQTTKNTGLFEGNRFGEHSFMMRCSFSALPKSGVEGMLITLNGNTYDKKGVNSFDIVNPSNGYWNTFDLVFMNNVLIGAADSVKLAELEAKARSYAFSNNTMLGYS